MSDAVAPLAGGDLDATPRRLHPATMMLGVIRGAPSTLLGIPAMLAVVARADLWLVLAGTAVAVSLAALVRWLAWFRFSYALTSDAVMIESGLVSRNRRTIPYERVADVGIERGPLHRLFGLASVTLETGGAGTDEGALDSVALAEAERLRDVVRRRRGVVGPIAEIADPGDQTPAAQARADGVPIFAMATPRVLLWGLFNFSLVGIAVGFGMLQYLGNALGWSHEFVWKAMVARTEAARSMPAIAWASAAVTGATVVLAVGVATGLIRAMLRDYGFRLTDEGGRLRRVRGLITRREAIVSLPRVQLVAIDSGPVRRRLGLSRLRAQVLGGEGAGGRQDLAPMAREDEIVPLLATLRLSRIAPSDMVPVARGHVWRALLRSAGFPLVALVGAALVTPLALLASPLLLFPVGSAVFGRRHHRYRVASRLLHVQRGVLSRTTWLMPTSRVQALTVRRSWLQRRFGLATVFVDTAGGGRSSGPDVHDLRVADAWTLVAELRSHGTSTRRVGNRAMQDGASSGPGGTV